MRLVMAGVLIVALFSLTPGQTKAGGTENLDPELIDPLQEDVGDFLNVDIMEYKRKAIELYNEQKYKDAAKYYLAALHYDMSDMISLYNLACCYGLLGEEELAAAFVARSVHAGYHDIDHIRRDPDFDKVRGKEVFDAAVDSIARSIEEKTRELGNVIYTNAPALMKCRLHLPENYDPEKSYTLIVGLHGYGSNPDGFIMLWKRFGADEFIYASPQGPYPFPVGTNVGYSWWLGSDNEALWNSASLLSEEYVCQVVKNICMNYNVETVYLMGFSQGCALTYMVGVKNHRLFKGLVCFGGWFETDWISERSIEEAKNLRVFIAHGKSDNSVKFEAGEKAFKKLKDKGYEATFEEFEGGHAVPEEIMQKAIQWIRQESK